MPKAVHSVEALCAAAKDLSQAVNKLRFAEPVTHIYNPLDYAWLAHEAYLRRYGQGRKRVIFVGMNPGPFGMAQTGVPFGEVAAVRDFLDVTAAIGSPPVLHPKRPIDGFACARSEVSGRRVWAAVQHHYKKPQAFFAEHFVANYCPLVFMQSSGKNHTPDKLPAAERAPLFAACDRHLSRVVETLQPEWVIGVGRFAQDRIKVALGADSPLQIGRILHPSPASPLANKGWDVAVTRELAAMGLCAAAQ